MSSQPGYLGITLTPGSLDKGTRPDLLTTGLKKSLPHPVVAPGKLLQLPGQAILGNEWAPFTALWETGPSLICCDVIER